MFIVHARHMYYLVPFPVCSLVFFPLALVHGVICFCAMWCLLFLVYLDFVCFFAVVFEKLTIGIIWDKKWKYTLPRQIPLLLNCVLVVTPCLETASSKFMIHGYRLIQEMWAWLHHHLQLHWSRWSLSLRAVGESPGENIVEPSLAICGVSWKF